MAEPRLIPEDEQALFNQSAASLPEELRQDARLDFEAGLLRADLQPTQRGQFEINLTQQFEPKDHKEVRGFLNRGLIDRNLQKTERGELYFSDLDTVLDKGEQAFYEWVKLGAWDEHSDRTGEDPVLQQVGTAIKSLATEVIPDAAGVAAQGITTNTPFIAAADWLGGIGFPEGFPFFGAFTKMRNARESARLSIKGLRDVSRKELAAGFGPAAAAAMDNQVVMDRGRQYLQAKMQAGVTGAIGNLFSKELGKADDAVILSLYDFEKSKKAMRDLSADEAAAAIASIATLGDEAAKMEAAEFAATTSEAARQGFTKAELADIDRRNANYGMIGTDISMPFTPAASTVAKGARVVGKKVGGTLLGRSTLHTLDKSERHLAALTARQQAVANSGSAPIAPLNAAGMKQTGARAARRTERAQAAQKTLQKLDDEIYEAKKIVRRHRTRLEGIGSQLKQGTRSLAQGMTTALARAGKTPLGEKALSVGSTIDEFFMNLQRQGGASSSAGTVLRALGFVGLTQGNPAAALAFPSIVSRNYRILKGAAEMIHASGSEFFKRRVSMPYWQRVSERVAKNPWARNGALTVDALATPLRPVKAVGKNLGASITRATLTEIPFAAMASGGEPGFLIEAAAEAFVFGGPGHVQGLVHGLGGAPAIMKKQEFDLLAHNDASELRRNLGLKQREIFDGMDPVIRRQLGVASALFPDLDFKFVPGSGGGAFHQKSKTVFIDPESKNPLDVLLAHEIGHALAARGMTKRVREDLVGPQGMLMDQDGNLTKEAQEFRREYEKRFGQKIDNNQLADEWFAEAVAPGLLKTQRLQKLVGRNKMIGGWVDSVLPKIPFAKRVLLQRGVLLDKKGNLAPGQGVMVSASLSPALARLADSYLRANAGSTFIPSGKKVPGTDKIVGGRTVEDLQRRTVYTRQDEVVMEERNMIDYERDPKTGRVIRDRFGRPKDVSPDILAAQATTLGNTIRKVAERNGLLPQSQKRGGDRFDNFEQEHWDEVVNEVRKTGLYNDSQLDAMRTAFSSKAANDGKAHVFQYQKALDTNERTGKKKYSPKPQENRVGSIYSIEVTKQNNVILRLIDIDALEANAVKAAASPEGIKKYGGDSAKIMRDLLVLAKNHSEAGKDNAIEFGEETAQFLNGVMGSLSKEHSSNNPKVIGGRPPVRSFRLDRANFIRETAEDGLPFNHHQWLKGLMPEPADATNQQSDAQGETRSISERGVTPGSTGQRGNSTISRGASAGRAGEAQQVLAGVQETAKRHKFGFAVDVKPQSFYNDPANTIYRSGDAGAAVTEGGDLVSVYSVPGGKGNIDAVLTDASQDAKTLDAFDVGGFLPNLYNRYGFKVVARVPFNREYAPPGWDFDAAGEPDVVLAVNDPSAEAVDYNEVRDSVPVFEDWDEAEAYRDKIARELDEAKADDIRRISDDDVQRMPEASDGSTPRMGVNINDGTQPFTAQILAGKKTIETRDSNSLDPYLNQKVGLVKTGQGIATLVGYADIVEAKKYTTEAEFRKDQDAHLVEPGSKYDWTPKGKVGYVLANPEAIEPYKLSSRGIVARDIQRMPEGDPQTSTPEFRNFFKESKVTDSSGKPLVVYHGSKSSNISEFDPGTYSYPDSLDSIGTWFTSAKNQAPRYAADATIYPSYLRIENPYVIKPAPDEPFKKLFAEWKEFHGGEQFGDSSKFVNHLRSKGHDGIVLERTQADAGLEGDQVADWFIAFDSKQIKSATDNRGTFDPNDPDIRRMPEDPTALPIVEARNADGSVKLNKKGKVVYESIDYDLVNAPGLKAVQSTPEDARTPDYDSLHYHITRKDKAAINDLIESGALDQAAGDLAADAESAMRDPEIAAAIGWYSRMRQKLREALGEDHQLFAELLGATSANTDVEQNFIYAFDAYRQFKAGKFDRMLAKFNEAVDLIESDTLVDVMVARKIVTKGAAKRLDQIELLKKWIKRYNLEPRRPDGKRYGMNSAHVFNALSGNFTKVRGPKAKDKLSPKTPQFSMNLFGSSLEATIDVWAARYLRRKLYAPTVKQWRIQPKSETGVSNADFLVGQEIFGRAAAKLGMNPDDLQALMWFKEKEVWDVSGWTKGAGALKSSFDEAADAFFPPKQQIKPKELAQANRVGLNSLNFIRKRRGVESKVKKLESLANQTGSKVTTAKRELRNAKAEFTKARKRAGVADFLERNPQLR